MWEGLESAFIVLRKNLVLREVFYSFEKYKLGCISYKNKSHIYAIFVKHSREGWLIGLAPHIRKVKNS